MLWRARGIAQGNATYEKRSWRNERSGVMTAEIGGPKWKWK